MCERFFRIQTELSAVVDVRPLLPSLVECNIMSKAFKHLEHFHGITIMLQNEAMTFLYICDIFDNVMLDYPELAGHFLSTAKIVNNPVFERAVVQIAKGHILTAGDKNSVSCLLLPTNAIYNCDDAAGVLETPNNSIEEEELSYAQKIKLQMRQRKMSNDGISKQYVNFAVLPGTSVSIERLFSTAKFILTDTRKSTSPAFFESIILLKVNQTE